MAKLMAKFAFTANNCNSGLTLSANFAIPPHSLLFNSMQLQISFAEQNIVFFKKSPHSHFIIVFSVHYYDFICTPFPD